jgi:AGCS family alanine or glycine:cation symporter
MFADIQAVCGVVAGYLWGWPMLILLVGTGFWLTLRLRGLQFRMLVPALIQVFGRQNTAAKGMISNRSALLTALAATVGTGNIAGVATAIALGGPGAMFWMWVSGLLGMALKYSETLLGVHYRVQQTDGTFRGGPMYYLSKGVQMPVLGGLFALFLAFAALSIGGMVQSNSIADAMLSGFGWNPTLVGGAITLVAATIMFAGLKAIARVADWLVPFMIVLYAGAGILILCANAGAVPGLFHAIFAEAFTGTAAAGGFAGSTVMLAMRYGLARGVFANESGLGSAPIVAATAKTVHPTEQALISMTQTFIDTFFVCTFTGLVILVTGAWQEVGVASAGASLTNVAFNAGLGNVAVAGVPVGSTLVALSLGLFAFTTILGWGYYGQQGAVYLFGKKVATPYMVFFLLCTFFGAAVLDWAASVREGVTLIWTIADIATGLMMLPNLLALCVLAPKVRRLTFDYLRHVETGAPLAYPAFAESEYPMESKLSHVAAPAAAQHGKIQPVGGAKVAAPQKPVAKSVAAPKAKATKAVEAKAPAKVAAAKTEPVKAAPAKAAPTKAGAAQAAPAKVAPVKKAAPTKPVQAKVVAPVASEASATLSKVAGLIAAQQAKAKQENAGPAKAKPASTKASPKK